MAHRMEHKDFKKDAKNLAANLNQCPSSNHTCRQLRAIRSVIIPVQIREHITISNYWQTRSGGSGTLVDVVPISKFAVALLTCPTMYCNCTGSPVSHICYQRVYPVFALKIPCSYLEMQK